MATKIKLEHQCGRCPRVESEELSLEEAARLAKSGLPRGTAIKVLVDGNPVIEFEHLCSVCRSVVNSYLRSIGKKLKHQSALRQDESDVKESPTEPAVETTSEEDVEVTIDA